MSPISPGSLREPPSATPKPGSPRRNATGERALPLPDAAVKRALDIVLSFVLLALTLPLVLFAMAAVWLETPGSPVYQQMRLGRDGRPFRLFKVRTMLQGNSAVAHQVYVTALIGGHAGTHGGMFKLGNDPRVTKVGRLLRRFSIDELPQLLNVLKGDMSIVGPRPALPYEAKLYSERDRLRLRVRPGLTGLWQVSGRATTSFREMVDLDIVYLQSWSLGLELSILLRTPRVVLTGIGAA